MEIRKAWGRAVSVVLFLSLCFATTPALAQSDAQKQQAKDRYEKARRYYDVGKYKDAIDEYQQVYLLIDDPNMLYNIAQAYRLWDKPEEAVRFYRNFLRRSANTPLRADVEKKINELERTMEERRRTATTPPTPAAPSPATPPPIDGVPSAAPSPPPPPPPVPTAPTRVSPPPSTSPVIGVTQAAPPTDTATSSGPRVAAYALLIGGGVLLAGAAVAGIVASQKAKEVEKLAMNRQPFNKSLESAGKTANTIAIVTGIAGAVAAIAGGVLLFTGKSSTDGASAEGPSLALYPLAAPGFAGAGARLGF